MTADWNVHGVDIINLTPCEGKREEGVRNITIRALGVHFLGAETQNLKSSKINPMGQPELFVDAYHQTYDLQLSTVVFI